MARICVYCSSSPDIDAAHLALARDAGTEIARRGHDLVSGGGRVSMMGAVADAVRAGGRHTIGVIPDALVMHEVADTDADELVVVPDMRLRKGRMDAEADAFLTLPGGIGTLEELLEIWVARSLGMHDKPVVVLDPTGVLAPLRRLAEELTGSGFVRRAALEAVTWASSVGEALDAIEAGLAAPRTAAPDDPDDLAEELLEAEP